MPSILNARDPGIDGGNGSLDAATGGGARDVDADGGVLGLASAELALDANEPSPPF
ncbi:MAG TPA: hypothetical protein VGQ57_17315 [Polyangiaceae bacterium]|nr:hypothetical protein [Polyangiaceae bacterium]